MKSKKIIVLSLLFLPLILAACGSSKEPEAVTEATSVSGQKVSDSLSVKRELLYPGIVASESEAKIIAKTAGTVTNFAIKTGDLVSVGQELGKIDDIGGGSYSATNFNTNQIKQAQIAVSQAQSAYQLAQTNYNNLLVSSVKDLRSAEIARDQASKGQSNLDNTSVESIKSAELAYETSKIATEQARLSLENRKKQSSQNSSDVSDNIVTAADSAINVSGAVINGVNNILALDDNGTVSISYRTNLGALDSASYQAAESAYDKAKSKYNAYFAASYSNSTDKLAAASLVAEETKKMIDASKYLLEKSIPSSALPQNSATGISLSTFQQTVSSYQTQMNTVISQVKSAKQSQTNVDLNNDATLDSLEKAYELAKQQEALAAQSLSSLKVGNANQKDQAGFAADLAQNQYENLKVKINSQIAAARSQMESANLQYVNAQVNLQNLFDVHSLIAPISGTLTRKLVSDGDTVSAGQLMATVSQTSNLKVQFYIESESLNNITPGLTATVESNNGKSYNGIISSVAGQADPISRRFLVEMTIDQTDSLVIGTVVNVKLSLSSSVVSGAGSILLPLSAVSVGQNANTIYIYDNGIAKKVKVELGEVIGEYVKVNTDLNGETIIITSGNKMLQDGQTVKLVN